MMNLLVEVDAIVHVIAMELDRVLGSAGVKVNPGLTLPLAALLTAGPRPQPSLRP
jgi:hypothetical protein